MQLTAPLYYKKFKCIADKCVHGCCSRWEIDIDPDTLARYKEHSDILNTLEYDADGTPHFKLCKNSECPHLTKDKLCSIIINHGEQYLCDICREHPRFYNNNGKTMEVGLGASCEEACRLIFECEDYITTQVIGQMDFETWQSDFDAIAERTRLYKTLCNTALDYDERLTALYGAYKISPATLSDDEWQDTFLHLEYLDSQSKALFCGYNYTAKTPDAIKQYAERYLAYLIYRHTSTAKSYEEFCAALGFCFLCERMFVYLVGECPSLDNVIDCARTISEEIEYSDCNKDDIMFEFECMV
ncbi:MAG: flagellin lysine-N-methylase [Clostridia bacterium]|nr:flagellin lysine-N-methylase [Clostridia bacterium]